MKITKKHWAGLASALVVAGVAVETLLPKAVVATRYVIGQVTKGTLVVSISGTGQVSGVNQLDITPTVSGEVTKVLVKAGDKVTAGTPLFAIDQREALKTVRDARQSVHDAQISLQSAKLTYQKSIAPPTEIEIIKAQNAVSQAEADVHTQEDTASVSEDGVTPSIERIAYDSAATELKTYSENLKQSLYDADTILGVDNVGANDSFENLLSVLDSSRLQQAKASYASAKNRINALKTITDTLAPSGDNISKIDSAMEMADAALREAEPLLQQTYEALLATLTSSSFTQSQLDSLRSKIQSDHSEVASKLSSMNSLRNSITQSVTSSKNAERNLIAAKQRLEEAKQSLADLQKGPEQIDVSIQQNSIAQRASSLQNALNHLADAQKALGDYTVKAPFDGVVANVTAKVSSQASASTKLATLLTDAKMVTVSLNEVDIAKVAVGQKATITFDAVPDLRIVGQVTQVDAIGTVSQGVVTYNVQVTFQTNDDRIKPGTSSSVSIATDVRTDVLMAPNSAIKKSLNGATTQVLPTATQNDIGNTQGITGTPESVEVEIGKSNDQSTEITSGMKEGDLIIIRTITPTTAATKTNTSIIPGAGGGNFGGGNATFRARTN